MKNRRSLRCFDEDAWIWYFGNTRISWNFLLPSIWESMLNSSGHYPLFCIGPSTVIFALMHPRKKKKSTSLASWRRNCWVNLHRERQLFHLGTVSRISKPPRWLWPRLLFSPLPSGWIAIERPTVRNANATDFDVYAASRISNNRISSIRFVE